MKDRIDEEGIFLCFNQKCKQLGSEVICDCARGGSNNKFIVTIRVDDKWYHEWYITN